MGKSLFDLITEAIVTSSPKDVIIHERTLASELIDSEKEGDPFALYDFLPPNYRGKNLVLTRHVIRILRNIMLFFIALFYALYDVLHKIFTGEWKSEQLSEELRKRRIPDKKWINRLHPEKWRGIKSSSGINAIILISILIMTIVTFVYGFHFLTKEVVLPDYDCHVNQYGIVSLNQGCLEEQHFFLLNAASFWTRTGIAVSDGDKVYITASGSMYSDIDEIVDDAKKNKALLYPRSDFHKKYLQTDTDAKLCIYGRYPDDTIEKDNKPVFGSLLYQIGDEVRGPKSYNDGNSPSVVRQINFAKNKNSLFNDRRYYFIAHKSGVLYFSFNDILLDKGIIDSIIGNKQKYLLVYEDLLKWDKTLKQVPIDSAVRVLSDSLDPYIWFKDNIGEALVNVRVEKNVWKSRLPLHKKMLVAIYRRMDTFNTTTENGFLQSGLFNVILSIILWFGADICISEKLKKQHKKTYNGKY